MGVAILSRICDSGRVFGTARHRVPPFVAESGRITWLFRITGLTGPLSLRSHPGDPDWVLAADAAKHPGFLA